jgi:DNA polymerase-1
LEYRLIAHETKDSRLLQIFKEGKDIHKIAATFITGKPEDKVTKEERSLYKTVNYASIYGVGKERFFTSIGRIDEDLFYKAKALYPGVNLFKKKLEARLNHTGKIRNMFGRERWFKGEISYSVLLEAFNYLFQSAGHSVLKLIIIDLMGTLAGTPCLLVNECHDSLMIDSPKEHVAFVQQAIKGINVNKLIEGYFGVQLDVPMYLETEIAEMWK